MLLLKNVLQFLKHHPALFVSSW